MNETIIILAMLVACIGILLYFVGWINTIFMALGKNQKLLGILIFIINPIAIYYSIKHWDEAAIQAKQLLIGLFIMCATIIPVYYYYTHKILPS